MNDKYYIVKTDFEAQIQSLSKNYQQCESSITEKMFQFSFFDEDGNFKTKSSFCEYFRQEINKLDAEELAEYLSEIILDKEDISMNFNFKFKKAIFVDH